MGYYTDYELQTDDGRSTFHEYEIALKVGYDLWDDTCKWYDWHECVSVYSKIYPDVIFTLKGIGEEYPDMWVAYFKNGESSEHRAEIVFPPCPFQ